MYKCSTAYGAGNTYGGEIRLYSNTDDGKYFWNLAIRTADVYTKDNLTQESVLYFEECSRNSKWLV